MKEAVPFFESEPYRATAECPWAVLTAVTGADFEFPGRWFEKKSSHHSFRVRPKTSNELNKGSAHTIELLKDQSTLIFDPADAGAHDASTMYAGGGAHRQKNQAFGFDCILGPEATQEIVYEKTAKDVIPTLLDGFNASVFAYGQTSAGKTFTMLGDRLKGEGVMVRAMKDLFVALEEQKASRGAAMAAGRTVDYALTFSYLEVYNEMIFDLLAPEKDPVPAGGLDLVDGIEGDVQVVNLTEQKPVNVEAVMTLLERGNARRAQSATDANENSSRSHAVLQIHMRRTEKKTVAGKIKTIIRRSKLSMIDLAGSERAKATVGREASLRKEGQNINKSLLALGNCINALSTNSTHVPYRDSKLTRLLKDSLGGNCRTIMIANVSPCVSNYEDTYSTLSYAKRAKNIRVTLTKAQLAVASASDNFNLAQIEALRDENERLREQLRNKSACGGAVAAPTSSIPSVPLSLAPPVASVTEAEVERCMAACRQIQRDAEALYARKLQLHKLAFSAWVKCQWARVRVQLLAHQMETCNDLAEKQKLQKSHDNVASQMEMHEFDMCTHRRHIAAVEEEITQLRDESSGEWRVFGPRLVGLRENARSLCEIQASKCESEMLKRECNVLRMLAESGWEIHNETVPPATPQMMNNTPVSLRLRTGSPGFKLPMRRLQFNEENAVAPAAVQVVPVAEVKMRAPSPKKALPEERKFLRSYGEPVEETPFAPAPAVPFEEASSPSPKPIKQRVVAVASPVADQVPVGMRSFGSSLSMLHGSTSEGISNLSLGSLSLDGSNSSSLLSSSTASASALPAPVELAAPRPNVRERLNKLLKERKAVVKDTESAPAPVRSSLTSPRVEHLAWSPVVSGPPVPDESMANMSNLSMMMHDRMGQISLSFQDTEIANLEATNAVLDAREKKIGALKLDIQQLHETISKSPVRAKSVSIAQEENAVNQVQVPSLIPRPGTRSRPGRVLASKGK